MYIVFIFVSWRLTSKNEMTPTFLLVNSDHLFLLQKRVLEASSFLMSLLRNLALVGLILLCFGWSYSHALLQVYINNCYVQLKYYWNIYLLLTAIQHLQLNLYPLLYVTLQYIYTYRVFSNSWYKLCQFDRLKYWNKNVWFNGVHF